MMERLHTLFLMLALAAGLLLGGFAAGWSLRGNHDAAEFRADTVVAVRVDTVRLVEARVDTLLRVEERLVAGAVRDTVRNGDTVLVRMPYEHRRYSKPDTLEVWYSGIDPKIDSAWVYAWHTTKVVREPYAVIRMPRLTLGLGAGAVWDGRAVAPFAAGALTLNRPRAAYTAFGAVNANGKWAAGFGAAYRIDFKR